MKQEIISFLSTCQNDINDLSKYLYEHPETSYNEKNSCDYICNLLEKYNFEIEKNYLDISNSFIAKKGSGHPKICYLCEYDAIEDDGHITGHNLVTSISVGAALSVSHIIEKTNGSVILIGCPGEYLGGTKSTLVKQGVFDDIDLVMVAHPDISTCESGSSSAIIPLGVKYHGTKRLSFLKRNNYSPLDSVLLTLNILNSLSKGFPENLNINSIISNGGYTPLLLPSESVLKFYIRASNTKTAEYGDNLIRKIVSSVSDLTNMESSYFLYECPNKELITNRTLNRLFSHNLKENGIIDINPPKDIYAGLSLGDVSHKVPCIHPYISIVPEDCNIEYGSLDFAKATISEFAQKQSFIASSALAYTAVDLLENESLLAEVKDEFFSTIKD